MLKSRIADSGQKFEKGIFKLYYENKSKGEKVLLNGEIDPGGDLHDIFSSLE